MAQLVIWVTDPAQGAPPPWGFFFADLAMDRDKYSPTLHKYPLSTPGTGFTKVSQSSLFTS